MGGPFLRVSRVLCLRWPWNDATTKLAHLVFLGCLLDLTSNDALQCPTQSVGHMHNVPDRKWNKLLLPLHVVVIWQVCPPGPRFYQDLSPSTSWSLVACCRMQPYALAHSKRHGRWEALGRVCAVMCAEGWRRWESEATKKPGQIWSGFKPPGN